jgi:hypothetical protein
MGMRIQKLGLIEAESNLELTLRERGKLVKAPQRRVHNIWLNLGREYLASLIAYSSFAPLTPERNDRIRYMGLGVGGSRQLAPGTANSPPIGSIYPGSNAQVDTATDVIRLERPVRVSGGDAAYPGLVTDIWLGQVQAPATHPTTTSTTFRRLFGLLEISYLPFQSVPLSEVGLFTHAANPHIYNNTMVAYDTFDTLSKTDAFELEVAWTIRF